MLSTEMNSAAPMKRPKLSTDATTKAAGLMIVTKQGRALFLQRSDIGDHDGEWAWPAGKIEDGETPEETARRETQEEIGWTPKSEVREIDNDDSFTTFRVESHNEFIPKLNEEHSGYAWASLDDPPEPLHPGCRRVIDMAMDADFKESEHPRDADGKFGSGGGSSKTTKEKGLPKRESEAQKKVDEKIISMRDYAKESAGSLRERMVVMKRDTGEILDDHNQELELNVADLTHGLKQGSGFSNANWFTKEGEYHPDNSILDLHTHPIDQSFSDGDWAVFSRHTIGEMKVVSANMEFTLTKTPEFLEMPWQERTPAVIKKAFSKHSDDVADEILNAVGTDVPDDFVDQVIHEANIRTAKQFHIEYDVKKVSNSANDALDKAKFEEGKHPRGQPGNAGQFGPGGGGQKQVEKPAEKKTEAQAPQPSESKASSFKPGIVAQGLENATAKKKQWAEISPIKAKEDLWSEGAVKNQEALAKVSAPIAQLLGLMFKDPGIKGASDKGKARIQEKIEEGKPPNRINDGVRAGFRINTPGQADKIVEGLSKHFEIADEGWEVTPAGYFDRKVMVRFEDGQVGEVQIWHPELLDVKENKGHKLYEDWRTLKAQAATGKIPPDDPRLPALENEMKELYAKVHKGMSPDWMSLLGRGGSVPMGGGGKPGNMDSKRALDSKAACIATSMLGADIHVPLRKTKALPGRYIAGSPSHEQYCSTASVILDSFQILKRFVSTHAPKSDLISPTYSFDKAEFKETDHPRGQPGNAGQFGSGGGGGIKSKIQGKKTAVQQNLQQKQAAVKAHVEETKKWMASKPAVQVIDSVLKSHKAQHVAKEAVVMSISHLVAHKAGLHGGIDPHVDLFIEHVVHEFAHTAKLANVQAKSILHKSVLELTKIATGKIAETMRGVLRMFGVVTGDEKIPKVEARYTNGPVDTEPCNRCSMYRDLFCTAVVGEISPNGHCKLWESDGRQPAQDAAANEATEKELRTTIKYPPPKSNSPRVIDQSFARGGLKQGESLHYAPKAQAYENRGGHDEGMPVKRPSWAVNGTQPKIDRTHTTEWLSVLSRDGETFFIDSSIPEQVEIGGKTLDPAEPLIRHECSEFEWMQTLLSELPGDLDEDERLKIYHDSHTKAGTVSERAAIEELGINWKQWSAWCRGEESRLSKRGPGDNPVPDPDVKPAPHRHGELESVAKDQAFALAYDKSILVNLGNGLYVKAPRECLAFDERTARFYDKDARLHLAVSNISKAVVNPYLGKEIPEFEQLGLEPNRIYRLYRDPEELAKAAPTFNGIPVLSEHVAVDAMNHRPDLVIGATGTDANFANPYLQNSLVFWAGDAIQDIESEEKKELSSAYRYRACMTPGSVQGEKFDGVMRDIIGNHVALVKEGRAGSDVVVGDSKENVKMPEKVKPRQMSRQAAIAVSVLSAHLRPKLAKDAKLPLFSLLDGVTTKNFQEKKPDILSGLKSKLKLNAAEIKKFKGKPRIAMDATIGEVAELLDMIESHGVEGDNDDMIDVPKPVEQMAQPVPEAEGLNKEKPPMLPEGSPEEEAAESPEQEAAEMAEAEGEGGDPTAEVQGLLVGKVDDATLAKVMEIIKSAGAHAHDNEEMAEKGAEDAEGGEEKLKELGAADELEEDANSDKGTGTGKGTPGGGSGSAEDSLEEDANSDKGTGTGKGSPGGGSGSAEDEEMDEKEKAAKDKRIGKDNPPPFKGMPKPGGTMVTQDSVNAAIKAATDTERKNQRAIREAERVVRPLVGEMSIAFDSADEVYKNALTMLGVKDADKIHPSAYPQLLDMCRQTRQHNSSASPIAADMAMDEGDDSSYQEMFPEADHIGTV